MTLADALPAKKTLSIRRFDQRYAQAGAHQFIGSLMVPKRLDDGSYPVVDVWTAALREVLITPYNADPARRPLGFIGASEVNHLTTVKGKRLMHIDTARGVEPVGYGFGFTLYAATALAVKFAGPDGIYSQQRERSVDATELWARMRKLSFGWVLGPLAHELQLGAEHYYGDHRIDYILGQAVLDSGLVVRLGQKYGKQWASFRAPPTKTFAFDMKYKVKKLTAWEQYTAHHAA